MKFIHLADLHLGKSVLEAPMLEDQRLFLDGVLETAVEEKADVILLAGDLYDVPFLRPKRWRLWTPS